MASAAFLESADAGKPRARVDKWEGASGEPRRRPLLQTARMWLAAAAAAAAGGAMAAEPAAEAFISVDLTREIGAIKPMHAVNNGPTVPKARVNDQKRGNFIDYRAARLPFARTHDSINNVSGGAHTCDVKAVFPNFDADENDPRNYDFVFTDHYLDAIRRAGTEVFFRLGQTIEHGPKKYGVLPPKDYAKWARICEHIVLHYNEGWGWGLDNAQTTKNIAFSNQFNVVYWEIWNEPDLDPYDDLSKNVSPRCWGGTVTNFFEFFETAARHLKGRFPNLKIGGPGLAGEEDWAERFLKYCADRGVPLDFFSWHVYANMPETVSAKAGRIRRMMDANGFGGVESILNEWNYVKGWTDDFVYSLRADAGDLRLKGAMFAAATMALCQCSPVDMLMYYNATPGSLFNGLFDRVTLWPSKGYYPFYAWSKMVDRGVQTACDVKIGKGAAAASGMNAIDDGGKTAESRFYAVAAKGNGGGALFVVRYGDDDNVSDTARVTISVPGARLAGATCHMTDFVRSHTEVPPVLNADGTVTIWMQPRSFAFVEW